MCVKCVCMCVCGGGSGGSHSSSAAAAAAAAAAAGGIRGPVSADKQERWRPLLLLIPLRLGLDELQAEFWPELRRMFAAPQSLGAIGGRPNSAFYFVGTRGTRDLIYLDPHTTQGVVDMRGEFSLDTYSARAPRFLRLSNTDPSLCLGFLCPTRRDYDALLIHLAARQASHTPLFTVCDRMGAIDLEQSLDDFALSESEEEEEEKEEEAWEVAGEESKKNGRGRTQTSEAQPAKTAVIEEAAGIHENGEEVEVGGRKKTVVVGEADLSAEWEDGFEFVDAPVYTPERGRQ